MVARNITSGTTNAGGLTTVQLTAWHPVLEISSRGADDLWVKTSRDGVDPTLAGDECEFVRANTTVKIQNNSQAPDQGAGQFNATEVRIFCATAIGYTVSGR